MQPQHELRGRICKHPIAPSLGEPYQRQQTIGGAKYNQLQYGRGKNNTSDGRGGLEKIEKGYTTNNIVDNPQRIAK
jgi:hypothetical protein